jgi:hypothetical protein
MNKSMLRLNTHKTQMTHDIKLLSEMSQIHKFHVIKTDDKGFLMHVLFTKLHFILIATSIITIHNYGD